MAWTDETKQQAIDMYVESEPTPANSMEVVKEIAEKFGESPNGLRMILSKAGVYVKKEAAPGKPTSAKATGDGEKVKRVGKADSLAALKQAIEAANQPVNDEVIDKMTAKAAVYFTDIISKLGN